MSIKSKKKNGQASKKELQIGVARLKEIIRKQGKLAEFWGKVEVDDEANR